MTAEGGALADLQPQQPEEIGEEDQQHHHHADEQQDLGAHQADLQPQEPAGEERRIEESCTNSRHKRMPRSKSWASQGGVAPNERDNMQKVTLINLIDERDRGEEVREAERIDKTPGEDKTEGAGKRLVRLSN